jgi:predicted HTH transcriptional regulator
MVHLIWWVQNSNLKKTKGKGNEDLEPWLHRNLNSGSEFLIHEVSCENLSFVVFEIESAKYAPISFNGQEFIRVGSYKKNLKDYPEKERKLWSKSSAFCFEEELVKKAISQEEVLQFLDYESFFSLLKQPLHEGSTHQYIIDTLVEYKLVRRDTTDSSLSNLSITNMGAILFARDLSHFPTLNRKKIRVIKYNGNGKFSGSEPEIEGRKGYASAFQSLVKFIMNKLPRNEIIRNAIREEVTLYPEIAIRELIANALIHQDFSVVGSNPMIEIFDNRIEITNSGKPLVDILRLIDYQPKSRNEKLASLMRRMGICEEQGSGIDKVIHAVEVFQLPAPKFIAEEDFFKVILFAPLNFEDMDKQDRIRATYQHCSLKFLSQESMTNSTLRDRFGLSKKQHSKASKIISDTLEEGLIKPADPENKSTKHIKYIPFYG